jgi:hypothetical protein
VHTALLAAEKTAEAATQLPLPPYGYGLLAFGGLMSMLLIAYAFRSVGTRHR